MKLRIGFVSNSSTSSTIISLESYENVFDLMIHVLEMIITEDNKRKQDTKINQEAFSNLIKARESDIDPNTPAIIGNGYSTTEVFKVEEGYHLTCHVDYDLRSLSGKVKEWIEGNYHELDADYYYLPQYDVLGKEVFSKRDGKKCNKHFASIATPTGEIFCPICNSQKLKSFQISPHKNEETFKFEKMTLYKVEFPHTYIENKELLSEIKMPDFNRDDILILGDGKNIYLWFGLSISPHQKDESIKLARKIKRENLNNAMIHVMDQGEEDKVFLDLIGDLTKHLT